MAYNVALHSVKFVIPGENDLFVFWFLSTEVAYLVQEPLKVCHLKCAKFTHEDLSSQVVLNQ